jgi:uncharacterized protein YlxW (UPF0749 family)
MNRGVITGPTVGSANSIRAFILDTPVTLGHVPRGSPSKVWWRIGTPIVILLSGTLFVASAQSSQGTDLRPGRYDDLAGLAGSEAKRYQQLEDRIAELTAEVDELSAQIDDDTVQRLQAKVDELKDPAGLTPRIGPGVTVTLSDAPDEVIETSTQELKLLVVHQQDIQAVVNAMWAGGAEAVTIQGQRIISTTGISCEGNSVMLQGVPYPQPYVIEAVGDPGDLATAIADDAYLQIYRDQSEIPDIAVGWDLELADDLSAPAYEGLLDLSYAHPAPTQKG